MWGWPINGWHRRVRRPRSVDREQAIGVFKTLLFSPVIGFVSSALLFLAMKYMIRVPKPYTSPEGRTPPPWPIRTLPVLTCTGELPESTTPAFSQTAQAAQRNVARWARGGSWAVQVQPSRTHGYWDYCLR